MSIEQYRTINASPATRGHIHPATTLGAVGQSDAFPAAFVAGPYAVEGSIHQTGRAGDTLMDSLGEEVDRSSAPEEGAKSRDS